MAYTFYITAESDNDITYSDVPNTAKGHENERKYAEWWHKKYMVSAINEKTYFLTEYARDWKGNVIPDRTICSWWFTIEPSAERYKVTITEVHTGGRKYKAERFIKSYFYTVYVFANDILARSILPYGGGKPEQKKPVVRDVVTLDNDEMDANDLCFTSFYEWYEYIDSRLYYLAHHNYNLTKKQEYAIDEIRSAFSCFTNC